MARKTRDPETVEKIRENIVKEAMSLIIDMGFDNLSLRKLADRVGMSATNIYYYFSGKDEIYLNIQIKGFKLLQDSLDRVYLLEKNPLESLRKMIRAYLEFGFNNRDYYQIMLNSDTPRYLEYKSKNSPIEPVAFEAKQMAINAISSPLKVIEEILRNNGAADDAVLEQDALFRGYQLWITLHGIVTLNNRDILLELDDMSPEKLIDKMCEELMLPFQNT